MMHPYPDRILDMGIASLGLLDVDMGMNGSTLRTMIFQASVRAIDERTIEVTSWRRDR